MSRKEDLIKIFEGIDKDKKQLVLKLIDEILFLEEQINEVKKFSFYRSSKDRGRIYPLDSLKIYKELSNQYNQDIKTLATFLNRNSGEETSPLNEWLKNNKE